MSLQPGQMLSHYRVAEKIGEGGMGEVYRARDTRLDRVVAVKILPATLSDNEQIRARFEREAKTISQLNHPNICILHDIVNADGSRFLWNVQVGGASQVAPLTIVQNWPAMLP